MLLQGWIVVVIALAYIGFLFLVASYGDRRRELAPAIAVARHQEQKADIGERDDDNDPALQQHGVS